MNFLVDFTDMEYKIKIKEKKNRLGCEGDNSSPQSEKTQAVTLNEPRPGDLCHVCNRKHLDYDGLLNLVCPDCGIAVSGCFT